MEYVAYFLCAVMVIGVTLLAALIFIIVLLSAWSDE